MYGILLEVETGLWKIFDFKYNLPQLFRFSELDILRFIGIFSAPFISLLEFSVIGNSYCFIMSSFLDTFVYFSLISQSSKYKNWKISKTRKSYDYVLG